MLDNCPSVVVKDFIRMWNAMDQHILGISLTTPMFSDGEVDYSSWKVGPKWLLCASPTYIHSQIINKTNDLILNLTPENVTQHSRIVTTTTPTKMSKIIGRQIH